MCHNTLVACVCVSCWAVKWVLLRQFLQPSVKLRMHNLVPRCLAEEASLGGGGGGGGVQLGVVRWSRITGKACTAIGRSGPPTKLQHTARGVAAPLLAAARGWCLPPGTPLAAGRSAGDVTHLSLIVWGQARAGHLTCSYVVFFSRYRCTCVGTVCHAVCCCACVWREAHPGVLPEPYPSISVQGIVGMQACSHSCEAKPW